MLRKLLTGSLFLFALAGGAAAQNCGPLPNTLANGANADATQVMADLNYVAGCVNALTSTPLTSQTFRTGSGTYATPTGVKWIRVRMVGGGGGGSGSGTVGAVNGGNGGNTTFGTSLLVANGGSGGLFNGASTGGTASLGSGPIGIALSGAASAPASYGTQVGGGAGASSPLGGGGAGGSATIIGVGAGSAPANTGAGGGGGGTGGTTGTSSGTGGGAGGYIDAIINNPAASYSYAVGAAGSLGSAGTAGASGGNGGSGGIWVEEHYAF